MAGRLAHVQASAPEGESEACARTRAFPSPKAKDLKLRPSSSTSSASPPAFRSSPSLPPPAQLNSPPRYHLCCWSQVLFASDRNTYVHRHQPFRRLTSVESHCFPDASGCYHHNAPIVAFSHRPVTSPFTFFTGLYPQLLALRRLAKPCFPSRTSRAINSDLPGPSLETSPSPFATTRLDNLSHLDPVRGLVPVLIPCLPSLLRSSV